MERENGKYGHVNDGLRSSVGALPAENILVAKYTPGHWRALARGLKVFIAFGVSGVGVKLECAISGATGGFYWLFVALAAIAVVGISAGLWLHSEWPRRAAVAEQVAFAVVH